MIIGENMKIRENQRKLNNKAFTLMELIVVVAILIVMAGAAAVTVSMLDSSYVEDSERAIKDYISLGRTKSMSVSAKDWYITISKEGSDYYVSLYKVVEKSAVIEGVTQQVSETSLVEQKKLGAKVSVAYSFYTSPNTYEMRNIIDTMKLEMHFDPATGKITKVKYGDNENADAVAAGIGYIGLKRNDYDAKLKVFFNTGKCERE